MFEPNTKENRISFINNCSGGGRWKQLRHFNNIPDESKFGIKFLSLDSSSHSVKSGLNTHEKTFIHNTLEMYGCHAAHRIYSFIYAETKEFT